MMKPNILTRLLHKLKLFLIVVMLWMYIEAIFDYLHRAKAISKIKD